jgi:hypothetical protein
LHLFIDAHPLIVLETCNAISYRIFLHLYIGVTTYHFQADWKSFDVIMGIIVG